MDYRTIQPLGKREGLGTYGTYFDDAKYTDPQKAIEARDVVVIDLVKSADDVIHFACYHLKHVGKIIYHTLSNQRITEDIDPVDEMAAEKLVSEFDNY